jgi:hypothetical protein
MIISFLNDKGDVRQGILKQLPDGSLVMDDIDKATERVPCYFCGERIYKDDDSLVRTPEEPLYACPVCRKDYCFQDELGRDYYNQDGNYIELQYWNTEDNDGPMNIVFHSLRTFHKAKIDWENDRIVHLQIQGFKHE